MLVVRRSVLITVEAQVLEKVESSCGLQVQNVALFNSMW